VKNLNVTPDQATKRVPDARRPAPPTADRLRPPSQPTRRRFLVNCSVLAAAATVAPATLGGPARGRAVALEQIGPADFARQLNTPFVVRPERATPTQLVLVEIRPLALPNAAPNAEDARNEKFALLFRGSLASPLTQNTYSFEHYRVGRFEMFIVPIGYLDQSQCYYEAIFNRPARGRTTRNPRDENQ